MGKLAIIICSYSFGLLGYQSNLMSFSFFYEIEQRKHQRCWQWDESVRIAGSEGLSAKKNKHYLLIPAIVEVIAIIRLFSQDDYKTFSVIITKSWPFFLALSFASCHLWMSTLSCCLYFLVFTYTVHRTHVKNHTLQPILLSQESHFDLYTDIKLREKERKSCQMAFVYGYCLKVIVNKCRALWKIHTIRIVIYVIG